MTGGIGEKIKALRKEMKMTQAELAGTEMTNSMLSQIENNVTNPSMKTLQYIAGKLNKPVSYFLEDEKEAVTPPQDNAVMNREREARAEEISELIDKGELAQALGEIDRLIREDVRSSKIYADILYKMGNALLVSKPEHGKDYLQRSIDMYRDCGFYLDAAKTYVTIGQIDYQNFQYEDCLQLSKKAFELYYKDIKGDISFEIELYYYKVMILSSLGHINETIDALKAGIELCNKSSIYYKIDEFYRIYAAMNYLKGNKEEYEKGMKKALQFAEFSENRDSLSNIYLLHAVEALDAGDAERALENLEKHKNYIGKEIYIYFMLKARALYIKEEYTAAYQNITKVNYPGYVKHKIDYLMMWTSKVYEGLILNRLGRKQEAVEAIKYGIEKMSLFGISKAAVLAHKSLSEVYSEMKDFEKAFVSLKKANDMQESIEKNEEIII